MNVGDGFLLAIRWLHTISAVAWVGGSLFYLLVLRPAARREGTPWAIVNQAIAREFKGVVDTCILVLIVTGVIMAFDRLIGEFIGIPYVGTLAVKILLALWMFYLALSRRRTIAQASASQTRETSALWQKAARAVSGYNLIAILGVLVFLLSDLLRFLVEKALG